MSKSRTSAYILGECEPARTIIADCGGLSTVATRLGVHTTTVRKWTYPKQRGGTHGWVPHKYHSALLALSAEHGKPVNPVSFLQVA